MYSEFYLTSKMFQSALAKWIRKYDDVDILDPNSGAIVPVHDESQRQVLVGHVSECKQAELGAGEGDKSQCAISVILLHELKD